MSGVRVSTTNIWKGNKRKLTIFFFSNFFSVPKQHQEVVQCILKNPSKVSLLVLDPESKAYFENNSINVSKFMVDIEKVCCPAVNPC